MEKEDTEPQEMAEIEKVEAIEEVEKVEVEEQIKQVPLSALQKERKKRQEAEYELQIERQKQAQQTQNEDRSYESATQEDLANSQKEAIRIIEERFWIKQNPEKYEKVKEYLPDFLKKRPNLATAINGATNRYDEAYILMEALTAKQQSNLKASNLPKKDAPNGPGGVPKSSSLNQAIDVMSMSDNEFNAWRKEKQKRR